MSSCVELWGLILTYRPRVLVYPCQVQIVASNVLLDPDTLCQEVNACASFPSSSTPPITLESFLLSFQKLLDRILQDEDKVSHSFLPPPGGGVQSLFHTNTSHWSSNLDKPVRKKPIEPKSGRITFLQIADIHLDLDYVEVRCRM